MNVTSELIQERITVIRLTKKEKENLLLLLILYQCLSNDKQQPETRKLAIKLRDSISGST